MEILHKSNKLGLAGLIPYRCYHYSFPLHILAVLATLNKLIPFIGGSKGWGFRDVHPPLSPFFHIFMQFSCHNNTLGAPPTFGVGAHPYKKSWIRHCLRQQRELRTSKLYKIFLTNLTMDNWKIILLKSIHIYT